MTERGVKAFNDEQVAEIRKLFYSGKSLRQIAKIYGVGFSVIGKVVRKEGAYK